MNDVDHFFDFYQWYVRRKKGKIYLYLHRAAAGGLVYYHPVFLATALAHQGHVAADHFHSRLAPWGYFITYRALVRFDTTRIAPNQNVLHSYKFWPHMVPFGKRIAPWYQRRD